jgi:hypothetical protein
MINEEVVKRVYVPDPQQSALYAMTTERLYVWRNREWHPTPTLNQGRTLLVDHNDPDIIYRGEHPTCGQEEVHQPVPFEISEDGGETWRSMPNGRNIRPLAIDPVFPHLIATKLWIVDGDALDVVGMVSAGYTANAAIAPDAPISGACESGTMRPCSNAPAAAQST